MTQMLIVAPHADDELIGCFTVLQSTQTVVAFLEELTVIRQLEAARAAAVFNYHQYFCPKDKTPEKFIEGLRSIYNFSRIYVPARSDWHPAHRRTNSMFRGIATHFYSVDMGEGSALLGDQEAEQKRLALEHCYPSQVQLWRRDHKYWLFENIRHTDFERYLVIPRLDLQVSFKVLLRYADLVQDAELPALWTSEQIFNHIVSLCPRGQVTMTFANGEEYRI